FLLSMLLLDRLKESAPARIITTASQAHQGAHIPFDDLNAEHSYRGFVRYGETKLANILFTTELARRLDGTGVTANCFHPGLVATGFNRNTGPLMTWAMTVLRPVSRSPGKGAKTLVWLATSPDVSNVSGRYFFDREQGSPSPEAQDAEAARRLWEISERQCAVSKEALKFAHDWPSKPDFEDGGPPLDRAHRNRHPLHGPGLTVNDDAPRAISSASSDSRT